jgi:hypothetical protein
VTLPNVAQAAVDDRGHFTASWRNWLSQLERTLSTNGTDGASLATDIAAIATALGSPDGTVANIPDQTADEFVIVSPDGTITVTGTPASGSVLLALQQLADSGVGAALVKITRDAYGRVSGTHSATTDDLTEGTTNKYYTDERAQDATAALFAAGTHTGITFTYDDANNKLSATVTGGGGAMTLVGTATVTGSAATSLTLSGLDLSTDGAYYVVYSLGNASAGSSIDVSMFFSGDTTATNYYTQQLLANNTSVTGNTGRVNNAKVIGINTTTTGVGRAHLTIDNLGRARCIIDCARDHSTGMLLQMAALQYLTIANVTSLTFTASVASTLAVGSYFKVFKVK